jgi:hypothetical protein
VECRETGLQCCRPYLQAEAVLYPGNLNRGLVGTQLCNFDPLLLAREVVHSTCAQKRKKEKLFDHVKPHETHAHSTNNLNLLCVLTKSVMHDTKFVSPATQMLLSGVGKKFQIPSNCTFILVLQSNNPIRLNQIPSCVSLPPPLFPAARSECAG